MTNVVQLICDLAETADEPFSVGAIDPECKQGVEVLRALGAVHAGQRPESITCRACDVDHTAAVEFSQVSQHYFHACPVVGLVLIGDADLATFRFESDWLVRWLWKALSIPSPLHRRALLPNRAWYLGDAACGDKQVTIVFARRISSQADLDLLASALRTVHPAEKGLVITTSPNVARQVMLPGGYEVLLLHEIVKAGQDGPVLDGQRIGFWIRGMQRTTAKGAPTRVGRPSPKARIAEIFRLRREQGARLESDAAEARAVLAEWSKHAPDQAPPGRSTIRGHVSELRKTTTIP
jgi:hypothetical protein